MRSSRPNAAVLLPLPGPVWTISRPFSTVLAATSASCTALRLAILAACRAASSSIISPSPECPPPSAPPAPPAPRGAGAAARPRRGTRRASAFSGTIPSPTSLDTSTVGAVPRRQRRVQRSGGGRQVVAAEQQVGQPQRQAIHQHRRRAPPRSAPDRSSGASTVRHPASRARPVRGDARPHLVVERLRPVAT